MSYPSPEGGASFGRARSDRRRADPLVTLGTRVAGEERRRRRGRAAPALHHRRLAALIKLGHFPLHHRVPIHVSLVSLSRCCELFGAATLCAQCQRSTRPIRSRRRGRPWHWRPRCTSEATPITRKFGNQERCLYLAGRAPPVARSENSTRNKNRAPNLDADQRRDATLPGRTSE